MDASPLDEIISLSIVFSLVGSIWSPFLRITSGLLCLGLAIALAILVARSLIIDEHVRVARAIPTIAAIALIGALELRWGRRTSASAH
jgi:hypothetical protein